MTIIEGKNKTKTRAEKTGKRNKKDGQDQRYRKAGRDNSPGSRSFEKNGR